MNIKKIMVTSMACLLLGVLFVGSGSMVVSANTSSVDTTLNNNVDNSVVETGMKLETMFTQVGNQVVLDISAVDLAQELSISLLDAQAMIDATKEIDLDTPQQYGFVGIHINLGKTVRGMNGWSAAVFVTGYVGWYAKQLAAAGPWGAGVAAVISASAGATAKWAVENGVRRINVGQNILGISKSFTIKIS